VIPKDILKILLINEHIDPSFFKSSAMAKSLSGNRIYAIEYGGNQGIWEITFPAAQTAVVLSAPSVQMNGAFGFSVAGTPGLTYEIDASSNLLNWLSVTSLISTISPFQFSDQAATNSPHLFYRAIQH